MAKKQDVKIDDLVTIKPITDNQKVAFKEWKDNKELFLHGAGGTGKTFISLYLALEKVLDPSTPYHCVYLIRSAVPTREIGFLIRTMKKIKLHCIRFHIRTWCSLCLNNLVTKHLQCCMID